MLKQCHTEYAYQRKWLLESSLLSLMNTKLYQDITVKDICEEAVIPRRTFYHYFDGKESVLNSILEDLMHRSFLEVIFDARLGKECIRDGFVQVFQFWQGDNRICLDLLIKNKLETQLMSYALQSIRAEKSELLQKNGLDPKLIEIGLMIGVTDFFSLLFYWSRNGYQETPEQMAEYAVWVLPQAFYNF